MSKLFVGIDTGGTFTDLVAADLGNGRHYYHKVPTTTGDPARGILDGIAELHFATRADFEERFFGSDAGRRIIMADVEQFRRRDWSGAAANAFHQNHERAASNLASTCNDNYMAIGDFQSQLEESTKGLEHARVRIEARIADVKAQLAAKHRLVTGLDTRITEAKRAS